MARFEEAENRMFNVKICLKCNARNLLLQPLVENVVTQV